MKEINILIIKFVSIFFGLSIFLGMAWFGDYLQERSIVSILFEMSTGVALILLAVVPNVLLKYIATRLFLTMFMIIGTANNIYMISEHWMSLNGPAYDAIILRIIILCFLVLMLLRIWGKYGQRNVKQAKGPSLLLAHVDKEKLEQEEQRPY